MIFQALMFITSYCPSGLINQVVCQITFFGFAMKRINPTIVFGFLLTNHEKQTSSIRI